jgi:hypothetical protein
LLLQRKAWDVLVNGAIGERRCNFRKIGQQGGPVQHGHIIGEWGGPIGQWRNWRTEWNTSSQTLLGKENATVFVDNRQRFFKGYVKLYSILQWIFANRDLLVLLNLENLLAAFMPQGVDHVTLNSVETMNAKRQPSQGSRYCENYFFGGLRRRRLATPGVAMARVMASQGLRLI